MASLDEDVKAKFGPKNMAFELNSESNIKNVIGVISGKGGVGKSTVTLMLALEMARLGYKVGIMDADITGPSIPKAFGLESGVYSNEKGDMIIPSVTKDGLKIMSVNLFLDDPEKPVLWRGPMIGSAIRQFYSDVIWGELDYLFIDMPPGTGDVAMTVFQSIRPDGIVIVSTPQDLVKMIVGKAVNMAKDLNVKILGLIENMSYMTCPCCGEELHPFGDSKLLDVAAHYEIKPLSTLPINPQINQLIDEGFASSIDTSDLTITCNEIVKSL